MVLMKRIVGEVGIMAMEESKAKVGINSDFLPFIQGTNNDSIDENVNLSLAIYLPQKRSHWHERLNLQEETNISDFIQVLINHNIHWGNKSITPKFSCFK